VPTTGDWLPSGDGLAPGDSLGVASAEGDGDGVNVSPPAGADSPGDGVAAGVEHAAVTTSTASRIGTRPGWRIGLVWMVGDVGGLDRGQGAVVQEARLATQQRELRAQPGGGVGQLEQVLLA
jgi:hypothetical protein